MQRAASGRHPVWQQVVVFVLAMVVAAGVMASPSNKWRVKMDGKASIDGEIELSFTPEGAVASSVVIPIPAGTHENAAARIVRDALKSHFGKDVYKIETDDGEDVLVKKRGKTPDFEIVVVRNTAEGLRVGLHRE